MLTYVWILCVVVHCSTVLCQYTTDFSVRMVSTTQTARNQGRVEVYLDGQWGTICHTNWDIQDANVVCKMLGFPGAAQAVPRSFFGTGNIPVLLTNVQCNGRETTFRSCPSQRIESSSPGCYEGGEAMVAGLVCMPTDRLINLFGKNVTQSSTTNGGVPERAIDGNTATDWNSLSCTHTANEPGAWWKVDLGEEMCITRVNIYNRENCCNWRLIDTIVRIGSNSNSSLNIQCGGAVTTDQIGKPSRYTTPTGLVTVRCHVPLTGRYISVHGGRGVNKAILTICEFQAYESDLPCPKPINFPADDPDYKLVRLSNGSRIDNGRIEVYHNGNWGSVCDRGWDIDDAIVLCKELGFAGAISAIPRSFYGAGDVNVILTNLKCTGKEASLLLCPHDGWENHANCTAQEIASVACVAHGQEISLQDMNVEQSSTPPDSTGLSRAVGNGEAGRAIDGLPDAYYDQTLLRWSNHPFTCTETEPSSASWWRVDLKQEECINKVMILNRPDKCCYDRLINTVIKVGNDVEVNNATLCGTPITASQAHPGAWTNVFCGRPIRGRYLFLQGDKKAHAILSVCEVKVFKAEFSNEFCSNSAPRGPGVRIITTMPSSVGRVEVYHQGEWGAICFNHWYFNDADVICRSLGFERGPKQYEPLSSLQGQRVWLDNVQCTGNEPSVFLCPHDGWGNHQCTTGPVVGIECNPTLLEIPLYGKFVQQSINWYVAGSSPDMESAELAIDGDWLSCAFMGVAPVRPWWMVDLGKHYHVSRVELVNSRLAERSYNDRKPNTLAACIVRIGSDKNITNNLQCGFEITPAQVSPGSVITIDCQSAICGRYVSVHLQRLFGGFRLCEVMVYVTDLLPCINDTEDNAFIRLVQGNTDYEGTVEVYHDGTWGAICSQDWDMADAHVVCKQLGFHSATNAFSDITFGMHRGPVWMSGVQCTGLEESLSSCRHDGWRDYQCLPNVAGVRCALPKYEIQLLNKPVNQSSVSIGGDPHNAVDGITISNFNVGSCMMTDSLEEQGTWWMVDLLDEHCISHVTIVNREDCCHDWLADTIVRVGLNEDISLNPQCGNPISPEQALPGAWIQVNCTQPQCGRYVSVHGGMGRNTAALTMCEVKVYVTECYQTCRLHEGPIDGDFVRLVGGALETEGRVEIYHNQEWRSVCGVGWDLNAANVVCRELGFLSATNALQGSEFGSGIEPVWLSNVQCGGDEGSITSCLHSDWGSAACPDGNRAGVMSCGLVTKPLSLLGHHATQSSVEDGREAGLAIDGNANPDGSRSVGNSGSCIRTGWGTPAWWSVDFDSPSCITRIDIRNREDCCHERLENAIVLIGNTNDVNSEDLIECGNPISEKLSKPGHWVTVSCDVPILGRYLFIVGGGGVQSSKLEFCEVQVFNPIGYTKLSSCTLPTTQPLYRRLTTTKTSTGTMTRTRVPDTIPGHNYEEPFCPQAEILSQISSLILTWKQTAGNTMMPSEQKCPEGSSKEGQPRSIRYCSVNKNGKASWMDPDIIDCNKNDTTRTGNDTMLLAAPSGSPGNIVPLLATDGITWSGRIGSIVIIVLVAITIAFLLILSNIRESTAHLIQVNFGFSLLLFNLVFLLGINASDSKMACVLVAALLHCFLIANLTWLAVDFRHVYLVVSQKARDKKHFVAKACFVSWGIALLIALVTFGVEYEMKEGIGGICFMRGPGLYYGICLPLILWLIYVVHASFLVIKQLRMRKHRYSESIEHFKAVQRFKSNVVLSVETFLTVVFLMVVIMKQSTVGLLLLSIMDIILGVSVLILYTCYQIDARNKLQSAIFKAQNPLVSSVDEDEMNANVNPVSVSGTSNPLISKDPKLEVELKNVSEEHEDI